MVHPENLGIFLPFLIAAARKTAQGSSTVAIITTASINVMVTYIHSPRGDTENVLRIRHRIHKRLAFNALACQDYKKAAGYFGQIVRWISHDKGAHYNHAVSLVGDKRYDEARRELMKELEQKTLITLANKKTKDDRQGKDRM